MTRGHPLFIKIWVRLYLHADVPSAPDNGAEIADSDTVADTEDGLLALDLAGGGASAYRSRDKADAVDDVITLDEEGLAGLDVLDGAALVGDLGDSAVQVDGNLVVLHRVTQVGGIGKAGRLRGDEAVCVLDDDGVRAVVAQPVLSRAAGGLAAADEEHLIAKLVLLLEYLREGERLFKALYAGHGSGNGAGSDDDIIIAAQRAEIVDLGVEVDFDAGLLDLSCTNG